MKIKILIGNKLKLLRVAKGLSQSELAEILETSQNEVSTWENGKRFIPWVCAYKLMEKYRMSFSFFDREEKNNDFTTEKLHNNLPLA